MKGEQLAPVAARNRFNLGSFGSNRSLIQLSGWDRELPVGKYWDMRDYPGGKRDIHRPGRMATIWAGFAGGNLRPGEGEFARGGGGQRPLCLQG